jgi:hypothetical protein
MDDKCSPDKFTPFHSLQRRLWYGTPVMELRVFGVIVALPDTDN